MGAINTVQIKNTDLVRDMGTNAVLSTDTDGLRKYKEGRRRTIQAKREAQETKSRLTFLESEIESLKKLIGEITSLKGKH